MFKDLTIPTLTQAIDECVAPFTAVTLEETYFPNKERKSIISLLGYLSRRNIIAVVGRSKRSTLYWRNDGQSARALYQAYLTLSRENNKNVRNNKYLDEHTRPTISPDLTELNKDFPLGLAMHNPAHNHIRYFPA